MQRSGSARDRDGMPDPEKSGKLHFEPLHFLGIDAVVAEQRLRPQCAGYFHNFLFVEVVKAGKFQR
jgi:hypothetical protein